MKQIPAALQAHYDSGGTSVAHAIVIQRTDGQLYGFTSHDLPFVLDVTPWGLGSAALVFDAKQGLTASNLVSTSGFAVDNLELTTPTCGPERHKIFEAEAYKVLELWNETHDWSQREKLYGSKTGYTRENAAH